MSKINTSFNDGVANVAAATTPAPEAPGTTAVTRSSAPTAVATVQASYDDFDGELDQSDIKMPKFNIAQKIGPLSEDFPGGAAVLNRTLQLAPAGVEVFFTPIRAKKTFVESLPYGSETFPRIFDTKADAEAAGLRVEFGADGEKPEIGQSLEVILLLRCPEVSAPEFSLEFGGEKYALAMWSISSYTAYAAAAKTLLTARTMYLTSFNQREWILKTEKLVLGNGNVVFIPKVAGAANHTDEFKAWTSSLLG